MEPTRRQEGGRGARGGRTARGDGARPGTRAAAGKGLRGPPAAGRQGLAAGLGGGRAAPTCAGRLQAQVAAVAQAAGLGLRGGFSITTSPAQERAGRGAAPRAAGARAGRGGRAAILGRARAPADGPLTVALRRLSRESHPARPSGPGRPKPLSQAPSLQPIPGFPELGRSPRPRAALRCEAPDSPCASRGALAPTSARRRTDRLGTRARAEGLGGAARSAPAPTLPDVLVERQQGRSAGDNNRPDLLTAYAVPDSVLNPLHAFILKSSPGKSPLLLSSFFRGRC